MSILIFYQIITQLLWPFAYLHLLYRRLRGKEDKIRFKERFGYSTIDRSAGKLIWVHAASVGESLSVLPLLDLIRKQYPNLIILITTGTVNSAEVIKKRLDSSMIHQYAPIDNISCINRFLKHWQPNLAIWVESELWPNLLTKTAEVCKIILLNARMSKVSYKRYQKLFNFSQLLLQKFTLILPQSKIDLQRFEILGARNLKYVGNIKYSFKSSIIDKIKLTDLETMIGIRKFWIAVSTHEGEEEILAHTHQKLKQKYPDILTIIIPRHPKRANDLNVMFTREKLRFAQRSKQEVIKDSTDIYLADTIGETMVFYYLAPIAVIGGSFVPHGGHNPIEAAHYNCAIITGPHIANFEEIYQDFLAKEASLIVNNEHELYNTLIELFEDQNKRNQLIKNAKEFVDNMNNILVKTNNEIQPFLPV